MPTTDTATHKNHEFYADLESGAHLLNARAFRQESQNVLDSDPLMLLNARLDRLRLPHDVNEADIEALLQELEALDLPCRRRYRLLTARLLETALICAGHYADHCEYSAAGDLLVNPREVWVYTRNHAGPTLKQRHGALSQQFAGPARKGPCTINWLKNNVWADVTKPALLPTLLQRLEQWGDFNPAYLASVRQRMEKIADTTGFLSAWSVIDSHDLHLRRQSAPEETRRFINSHLCRFGTRQFDQLGVEIRRLHDRRAYKTSYLSG